MKYFPLENNPLFGTYTYIIKFTIKLNVLLLFSSMNSGHLLTSMGRTLVFGVGAWYRYSSKYFKCHTFNSFHWFWSSKKFHDRVVAHHSAKPPPTSFTCFISIRFCHCCHLVCTHDYGRMTVQWVGMTYSWWFSSTQLIQTLHDHIDVVTIYDAHWLNDLWYVASNECVIMRVCCVCCVLDNDNYLNK